MIPAICSLPLQPRTRESWIAAAAHAKVLFCWCSSIFEGFSSCCYRFSCTLCAFCWYPHRYVIDFCCYVTDVDHYFVDCHFFFVDFQCYLIDSLLPFHLCYSWSIHGYCYHIDFHIFVIRFNASLFFGHNVIKRRMPISQAFCWTSENARCQNL